MTREMLRKYARLIAVKGGNVQKDQRVILNASVDQYAFVGLLIEECYKAGAVDVRVNWSYEAQTLLDYRYKSLETLSKVPAWREAQLKENVETLPCMIHIVSDDPAGLAGIDREKMMKARQATWPILKPYSDALENKHQWCIAAAPSKAWAKHVFPELSPAKAVEKLWEAILASCHVTRDNDPVQAWNEHNRHFDAHSRWLNEQRFDAVTYHSANGTDFRAQLIPQGMWCGGSEETIGGVVFNPNMPTEEIFTTPMKGKAEGTLVSTKPLSYQGQIIDGFSIEFRDGKAVSWKAEKGQELLDNILNMDEGARYLGELALVPVNSPISNSGILFYETLFDENASCHVALGRGFNDCIQGFQTMTDEECQALGVNDSMIHVDFMIGAPDMTITGWKDGKPTPIFINGDWAMEL